MGLLRHITPQFVRAMLFTFLVVVQACRVGDPEPGQSIPEGYVTDREPASTGIAYGPDMGQLLDIYPAQGAPSGTAIVYVHSGGWVGGSKDDAKNSVVIQYLMDQGHVIFSIDYALATTSADGNCETRAFPENIFDVKWAISWANLQDNKNAYGYSRVAVLGESAGAHLTSLAVVSDHVKPANMDSSRSVRPDAGIALGGPSNMVTFGAQGTSDQQAFQIGGKFYGLNLVQCFFGPQYTHPDDVPALLRIAATPEFFVDANDPPIYIASGTDDPLALPEYNADLLEQKYIDLGEGATYSAWNDRIEGGGHNTGLVLNIAAIDLYLQFLAAGVFD